MKLESSLDRKTRFDLIVASVLDRGHWLAEILASQGWKVAVLDLTHQIEPQKNDDGVCEDSEGPFGLFKTADLNAHDLESFAGGSATIETPFSLWLKSGPMELHGPLVEFHRRVHGIPDEVEKFVRGERARGGDLNRLSFQDGWLAPFAQWAASSTIEDGSRCIADRTPTPLYSEVSTRPANLAAREKALARLESAGAFVIRRASVSKFEHRAKADFEIVLADGAIRSRSLVWTATSLETATFFTTIEKDFFPGGPIEPAWLWSRVRVEFANSVPTTELSWPETTWAIEDIELPWCERNVMILRKTPALKSGLDVWVLLEKGKLTQEKTMTEIQSAVLRQLKERFPKTELSIPSGGRIHAAPAFGVFAANDLGDLKAIRQKAVYISSPETWGGLDPRSRIRSEKDISTQLGQLMTEWVTAERKAAQRAKKEVSP